MDSKSKKDLIHFHLFNRFFFFLFRAMPLAYGGSQARCQIGAVAAGPMPQPQQCLIWAMSVTYTIAHSNTGSLIHWARPGIELASSWMLVRFVNHWAITGTLILLLILFIFILFYLFIFCLFVFSRAAPMAYGGSQARGPVGAAAAGLYHSHSNTGSEPCLQPTPQLMATSEPESTERGQGSNLQAHGSLVGFVNHWATTGTPNLTF